jgi:hypothetical protein
MPESYLCGAKYRFEESSTSQYCTGKRNIQMRSTAVAPFSFSKDNLLLQ